jgi:hypothetical protein
MPNVIGVLHTGATHVLPVVSSESGQLLESFDRSIKATQSRVLLHDPIVVQPYDSEDCLNTMREALPSEDTIEINWTGGTKVMSFAARRLAEERKMTALYVNTIKREVILEDLATGQKITEDIDTDRLKLNVSAYLHAAGHLIEGGQTFESYRARSQPDESLILAAEKILDARASENFDLIQLSKAKKTPYAPRQLSKDFISILINARLITQSGKGYILSPETYLHPFHAASPQDENEKFLCTTFLEVFCWAQIRTRCAIDDVAWHVLVNPGQKGMIAELDVVVAHEGRLLVLECKRSVAVRELADLIEQQGARTRRMGRILGQWIIYVHRFREEFAGDDNQKIISSQQLKAAEYGGTILWQDDLSELHETVMNRLHNLQVKL